MSRAALIAAIDDYITKADEGLEDRLEGEGFVDPDETVEHINNLEKRVAKKLKGETRFLLGKIAGFNTIQEAAKKLDSIFEQDKIAEELGEVFFDEYKKAVPKMTWKYVKEVDSELTASTISAKTGKHLEEWSTKLGEYMKLDSHKQVEKLVRTHFEEGKSVAELTRAIKDSGIRDEYYKAKRVAQTEMLRAHSFAKHEASMQNPAVSHKMWRHTGARKNEPRPNHVVMDGQKVPKDKPFTLYGADGGLYFPQYPRDPSLPPGESINCHCIQVDIVDDEILGMTLEERQQRQQEAVEDMGGAWKAAKYGAPHEDTGSGVFDVPITQFDRYRGVLGAKNVPNKEAFYKLRAEDGKSWHELKRTYRDVNFMKRCQGNAIKVEAHNTPIVGKPNSVVNILDKSGIIKRRRYYGKDGLATLDFDVTSHGNKKNHAIVPHSHDWDKSRKLPNHAEDRKPTKAELIANKDVIRDEE